MFCLADIKNKDNFGKTFKLWYVFLQHRASTSQRFVDPKSTALTTQMKFYNKVLCELYETAFDVNIAPL